MPNISQAYDNEKDSYANILDKCNEAITKKEREEVEKHQETWDLLGRISEENEEERRSGERASQD